VSITISDFSDLSHEVLEILPAASRAQVIDFDGPAGLFGRAVLLVGRLVVERLSSVRAATSSLEIAVLVLAALRHFKAHARAVQFLIVKIFDRVGRVALVFEFDEGVFGLDGNVHNSSIALEKIVDVSRSNSLRETPHPDGKAVFAHSVRQSKSDSKMG